MVRAAARRLGLAMPVALARGDVLGPLGMRAVPSTAFVDADGRIVALARGSQSRSYFEEHARQLLATDPPAATAPAPSAAPP